MSERYRKRLRLKDWNYSQAAVYMITVCIADRSHLLGEIGAGDQMILNDAGRMVMQEIEAVGERHPQEIVDSFVIMPNHIHLLVGLKLQLNERNPRSLREIIVEFKSRTTTRYIRGIKKGLLPRFDQHLWQVDYFETIMRNEQWTAERREYIANNPANWREDPEMDGGSSSR